MAAIAAGIPELFAACLYSASLACSFVVVFGKEDIEVRGIWGKVKQVRAGFVLPVYLHV